MAYNVLNIGSTGLNAMQNNLDLVANNIANVNTYGYKKKDGSFGELLLNRITESDVLTKETNKGINTGTRFVLSDTDFSQGILVSQYGEFNMAIEGEGFFGVRDLENNLILTRNGGFHINKSGAVTDDNGNRLEINYLLPKEEWNSNEITISKDGRISQLDYGKNSEGELVDLGQVVLYKPEYTSNLVAVDASGYINTNGVLYSSLENPEEFGFIYQHSLEQSTTDLASSMTELITTQRAYSFSSKLVQTTDEILSIINNSK